MTEGVAISGWLRKRPRFGTGSWSKRFFVLSNVDATIRAFSTESQLSLSSFKVARNKSRRAKPLQGAEELEEEVEEPEPSHSLVLPKDVTVTDPFEKSV